jgi:diguanylate cyclase (GGDEF)-like protein
MIFDSFSLLGASAIVMGVLAIAFAFAWHREPAIVYWRTWIAANAILALCIILYMVSHTGGVRYVEAGSLLFNLGLGLRWRAARQFNGRAAIWCIPIVIPIGTLILCLPLVPATTIFYTSTTVAAVQMAATAWEFWRDRADGLTSRYALVGCYALTAIVYGLRAVEGLLSWGGYSAPYPQDALAQVQIITLVINAAGAGAFSLSLAFERTAKELRSAALTDQLTGLPNRRALEGYLSGRLTKNSRPPGALVLFDIDHFKQINDQFGHATGDEILRRCAEAMRSTLRKTDFAARIGGEEFAIVLNDLSEDEALAIGNRVRKAIEDRSLLSDSVTIQVTVSGGLYYAPIGFKDFDGAFKIADDRLYKAKADGRNRIVSAA